MHFSQINHFVLALPQGWDHRACHTSSPSTDSLPGRDLPTDSHLDSSPQSPPASPTGGHFNSSVLLDPALVIHLHPQRTLSRAQRRAVRQLCLQLGAQTLHQQVVGPITPRLRNTAQEPPEARRTCSQDVAPCWVSHLHLPQRQPPIALTQPHHLRSICLISTSHSSAEASTRKPQEPQPYWSPHGRSTALLSHPSHHLKQVGTHGPRLKQLCPQMTCVLIDMETTTTSLGGDHARNWSMR